MDFAVLAFPAAATLANAHGASTLAHVHVFASYFIDVKGIFPWITRVVHQDFSIAVRLAIFKSRHFSHGWSKYCVVFQALPINM